MSEDCPLDETTMEQEERRRKMVMVEEQAVKELREHMKMEDEEKSKLRALLAPTDLTVLTED